MIEAARRSQRTIMSGKHTFREQRFAVLHRVGIIDPEYSDRSPTDASPANEIGSLPLKVGGPFVASGMEELYDGSRCGIDPCKVGSLVQVAVMAGEGKVRGCIRTTVLFRSDVFDMEGSEGRVLFRKKTVLTTAPGSLANEPALGLVHQDCLARRRRAFDCKAVRK